MLNLDKILVYFKISTIFTSIIIKHLEIMKTLLSSISVGLLPQIIAILFIAYYTEITLENCLSSKWFWYYTFIAFGSCLIAFGIQNDKPIKNWMLGNEKK